VIGVLRRAGFSVARAAHAFSALDSCIYGFVLQEAELPFDGPVEAAAMAEAILERIPGDGYPHVRGLTTESGRLPGCDYFNEFLFGLDLLLDGLERASARDPG
jgi:hypothetical protein